ncbi:MAG TPA: D-alanyl-D-alanine carboxypeptidase/D-alanyl-D-alanine-endopeptidase [Longimicrobium sp.]|jgi:D-alanyl-D-alanine carboxypeptidase/D-alanyl-D-alanine-endopeptidase (penicillin-binding protein 4)|uniref:D-alanyl-D-alanine carboxypeptidase/D-alanyl-D-alanine endopeptidase n=1 Tax=Longimicrobium sp. TaxID=2029185 RepID=UPI002EDAE94F
MKFLKRTAVPAALVLAVGGGFLAVRAATQTAGGALQAQASALVPNQSEWSVFAWSLDRNEPLFAINADQPIIPASNNKVYSAIWALAELGPDYRFPTDLLITGPVQNGVVRGDVVIRGSGDPAFGYAEYDKDPMTSPRRMAAGLKRLGVTSVEGGVIADPYVHDRQNYGPDWPRDTGNGAARYAPTVSGLPFNRNMLWVRMTPGGYIREPDVPEIPIVNRSRGGGGNAYAVRQPDEDTIRIRGGGQGRFGVGAYEPAYLAGGAIRQALREAGIQVRGPLRIAQTPQGATLVHRHFSIPLMDMVFQLGRHSDNFFAEHLWKAAVAKATGRGTYAAGGSASAVFFHDAAGIPWGQIWQADGSGLSAQNRTSAEALVRSLIYAHKQPWSAKFHESLSIAGDRGGTMARMFNTGPAAGNLHAKTGYINDVRTLSGYVKTASGENVVFSFLYNGRNTSGARGVQTNLGNLLAGYRR